MARSTIAFGAALVALGLISYLGTAAVSVTALIPTLFGAVLLMLGWLALNERYRRQAIYAAEAIALVGLFGAAPGLVGLIDMISGAEVQRPAAVLSQSVMALLMAVFIGLCLRSFIAARRARIPSE